VKLLLSVHHTYPDFRILLHAWICDCPTRELELREHQTARWLKCGELHQLDWAAADVPIVSRLQAEADEF
jgi:8-oxo-dGTP diphosphatase